jgi:hypothetical protein
MVVLSTLVINTVIEKSPLIFLALGEKSQGEIDAIIAPAYTWNYLGYFDYE